LSQLREIMRKLLFQVSAILLLLVTGQQKAFAQIVLASSVWDEAAYGSIPGVTSVRLSGWNPAITTTFEPMWGESAAYTPKTVAITSPICESSSANDAAAGTGARTISVTGLNTSFARFTETVTLNGTTSVAMATSNIMFLDKITVATVGSGLVNAGIVQCGDTDAGAGDLTNPAQYLGVSSPTAVPAAGAGYGGISESFFYGVPANTKLLCRNISCGSVFATAASGHECVIDGFTNSTGLMKRYFIQMVHNTGSNPTNYPGVVMFPEKTLILGKMAGVTGSDVGPASMTAECILIDLATVNTNQVVF
jgi:hypothetical protein